MLGWVWVVEGWRGAANTIGRGTKWSVGLGCSLHASPHRGGRIWAPGAGSLCKQSSSTLPQRWLHRSTGCGAVYTLPQRQLQKPLLYPNTPTLPEQGGILGVGAPRPALLLSPNRTQASWLPPPPPPSPMLARLAPKHLGAGPTADHADSRLMAVAPAWWGRQAAAGCFQGPGLFMPRP